MSSRLISIIGSQHLRQAVRFGISGGIATLIHLSVFSALVALMWTSPTVASGVGFIVGFGASFTLQKFWTFQDTDRTYLSSQLSKFLLLQASMLVLNMAGVYVLVEVLGMAPILGQIIILCITAATSYLVSKFLIFNASSSSVV